MLGRGEDARRAASRWAFSPSARSTRRDALTYRLCNCPYRDAVRESQQIVCTLHRGMTRGLLDAVSPKTKLAAFVPRDPYAAGCLIELRGELADQAAARIPDRS